MKKMSYERRFHYFICQSAKVFFFKGNFSITMLLTFQKQKDDSNMQITQDWDEDIDN